MQSEYLEADLPGNRLTIRECEVLKLMSGENTSASRVALRYSIRFEHVEPSGSD
jgi:hypothetical protein